MNLQALLHKTGNVGERNLEEVERKNIGSTEEEERKKSERRAEEEKKKREEEVRKEERKKTDI